MKTMKAIAMMTIMMVACTVTAFANTDKRMETKCRPHHTVVCEPVHHDRHCLKEMHKRHHDARCRCACHRVHVHTAHCGHGPMQGPRPGSVPAVPGRPAPGGTHITPSHGGPGAPAGGRR